MNAETPIRESLVVYNLAATKGKLCSIKIHNKGKELSGAELLGNGYEDPKTHRKHIRKNYAYIVDFCGTKEQLLSLLLTLHNQGLTWKRNQIFYNDNPTSFVVLDFDLLDSLDEKELVSYAKSHSENVLLTQSNSYVKDYKVSYKLYAITESPIDVSGENFKENIKACMSSLESSIFSYLYESLDDADDVEFTNHADVTYANNLLQLTYNQLRVEHPQNIKVKYPDAVYKSKTNFVSEIPSEDRDSVIELPRFLWEYDEITENVQVFKYNSFSSLFDGLPVNVTDCSLMGHIPNKEDRILPKKEEKIQTSPSTSENAIDNYAGLKFVSETFDPKHCHRRYMPTDLRSFCREWKIKRYFREKVYAPWLNIPVLKDIPTKIQVGSRHFSMLTRINYCIHDMIIADRLLLENGFEFQYDLYHVFNNVKNYCSNRFTDLPDFWKDHPDEAIYKAVLNAYRSYDEGKMMKIYHNKKKDDYYKSRLTSNDFTTLVERLSNMIDGDFTKLTRSLYIECMDSDPVFFDIDIGTLWRRIRKEYKGILPKNQNQDKIGCKYKTSLKFKTKAEFDTYYTENKHDSYWKKYHKFFDSLVS